MTVDVKLSHLDAQGNARMINVSQKIPSDRSARAECLVTVPEVLAVLLKTEDPRVTAKGSVFRVAELAGIMAAKRTAELIPLCHTLPLDHVHVKVSWCLTNPCTIRIESSARTTGRTGVEMEALTAASLAALTVYDMCKAMTHEIDILGPRLLEKTGGKSLVHRDPLETKSHLGSQPKAHLTRHRGSFLNSNPPLWGMILAGGRSTRMGQDKAWQRLAPSDPPAWQRLLSMLTPWVERAFVSCQADQAHMLRQDGAWVIVDPRPPEGRSAGGPAWAIAHALQLLPEDEETGLLVLACDLPLLSPSALERLVHQRNPHACASTLCATADAPEPLIAIWERASLQQLQDFLESGQSCPRQFLRQTNHQPIPVSDPHWLHNANTPQEWAEACRQYRRKKPVEGTSGEGGLSH